MIPQKDHWVSNIVGSFTDVELCELFRDIVEFRKTGLLADGAKLEKLNRKLRSTAEMPANMLKLAEYAVLFEMARRYHNQVNTAT